MTPESVHASLAFRSDRRTRVAPNHPRPRKHGISGIHPLRHGRPCVCCVRSRSTASLQFADEPPSPDLAPNGYWSGLWSQAATIGPSIPGQVPFRSPALSRVYLSDTQDASDRHSKGLCAHYSEANRTKTTFVQQG